MKRRCPVLFTLFLMAVGGMGWIPGGFLSDIRAQAPTELPSPATENTAQGAPNAEQMREMMDAWMATIRPGAEHEVLNDLVGEWETNTKMWFSGPGTPPVESKGEAKSRWVLGNRFVLQQFKGEFPLPQPDGTMKNVPLEGIGMTGFDRNRRLYIGSWNDTMNTTMLTMRGTMVPGSNTLRLYGEMDEPMLGIVGRTVKYETKIVSKNEHIFTIYDLAAGDDYKVAEITYKRKMSETK